MGAFTYPRSEPGSGGHEDLIEALNAITQQLKIEVDGIADAAATTRRSDDEWSLKQIAAHLCDNARSLHERLFMIINLEQPLLPSWDQFEEFEKRKPDDALLSDLVNEFSVQRSETVYMLADLVHWNWARTGRHEERGRLSIRQLIDLALEHEAAHIEQVRACRAAVA